MDEGTREGVEEGGYVGEYVETLALRAYVSRYRLSTQARLPTGAEYADVGPLVRTTTREAEATQMLSSRMCRWEREAGCPLPVPYRYHIRSTVPNLL